MKKSKRVLSLILSAVLISNTSLIVNATSVSNNSYKDIYQSDTNTDSFISVASDSFVLFAYYDDTYNCYVRGSTTNASISSSSFLASFSRIKKCDSSGTYTRACSH